MSLSIAFVPLLRGAKFNAKAIREDFAAKWPALPKPASDKAETDQIAFSIGDKHVIIALMRAPIPWSDLEGPCAMSWLWPKAADELRNHAGHLIVTVLGEEDPVQSSGLLSRVCASILATCAEAPGVYWGNAALVVPSKVFQDFTTDILPGMPPVYIWVDLRVGQNPQGKSSGLTHGMKSLGHMEFETETASEPPGELRERFFAMCNYVLENGPVIRDGDTIGEDANERIRVVYSKSAFGQEGPVMRLEYDALQAKKKGWFGR
jgi:hypothetical protein